MKITQIYGREILDSRGIPTIECHIELDGCLWTSASVPSGASVGTYEAVELRDGDRNRYGGKGVSKVIDILERVVRPALCGKEADVVNIDALLCDLDGTTQKSRLGANTTLAVSIAISRAQALENGIELYDMLAQRYEFGEPSLPYCMFNIFNGGVHAHNNISFQEFMIMPISQPTFADSLMIGATVYQSLKHVLKKQGLATTVGDEGGFAPQLSSARKNGEQLILDLIMQAVDHAGYSFESVVFALDVAASQFYKKKEKRYLVGDRLLERQELIDLYASLCGQFPLFSIEDGLDEEDWDGWQLMTAQLGADLQLVGDDLFVTSCDRIDRGIQLKAANAVLIKPNQIGTVTETMLAIKLAQGAGYKTIVSHRSGETNDPFIADLVVAAGAGQFKAGAPARGERTAKYNRLLEIEGLLK